MHVSFIHSSTQGGFYTIQSTYGGAQSFFILKPHTRVAYTREVGFTAVVRETEADERRGGGGGIVRGARARVCVCVCVCV